MLFRMTITLDLPDEIAAALGEAPERATLECLLAELYREEKIDKVHIGEILQLDSWQDMENFMNRHRVNAMTPEEFEADLLGMDQRRPSHAA